MLPSSSVEERTVIITTSDLLCKPGQHIHCTALTPQARSEVTEELRNGALPEDFIPTNISTNNFSII
ncbi:hypothetical protein F2Q69_00022303 [Brassica cretica]|uniref:Uncharacterized protein n=1 Tax=Brassica cretica TaxID=69181 RepID=A0A8S9Q4T6_BRACR|nr:hypothetical protein F2Q69_00022303 [Brassica cretica]